MQYTKGQAAIMGLIMGFMLIASFSLLAEPMLDFISIGVNATNGSVHGSMIGTTLNAIPIFIVLIILVAVVALITGRQS